MGKGPIIRKSDIAFRMRKLRLVLLKFSKAMEEKANTMLGPGGALAKVKWDSDGGDAYLLLLRRMLAEEIKEGTFGRQDRELEISILSMTIWFLRMEKDKRDAILSAFM